MGVGDQVPQALEQLGASVDFIDARASSRRAICPGTTSSSPACAPTSAARTLRANNQRLLDVRGERRHGARAVQQVRVQPGAVRTVSGEGLVGSRHRRERADRGPRSGSSGLHRRPTSSARDVGGLGAGARALLSRRARFALRRSGAIERSVPVQPRRQEAARWSRRASARVAGCTSVLASGGSCRRAPTAPISCWPT